MVSQEKCKILGQKIIEFIPFIQEIRAISTQLANGIVLKEGQYFGINSNLINTGYIRFLDKMEYEFRPSDQQFSSSSETYNLISKLRLVLCHDYKDDEALVLGVSSVLNDSSQYIQEFDGEIKLIRSSINTEAIYLEETKQTLNINHESVKLLAIDFELSDIKVLIACDKVKETLLCN